MKEPKYIQEIYTNEDKTLFQSIIYSIVLDEESNGLESKMHKEKDIKTLLTEELYKKNMKVFGD